MAKKTARVRVHVKTTVRVGNRTRRSSKTKTVRV